jgi:hypothetical protein
MISCESGAIGRRLNMQSALEISSGNELPATSDLALEALATLRVHPSHWHNKPCRAGRADI